MRIGALYDVHGNLPALEAVLADLDAERPDLVVVGGDFLWGPMPAETLEALRALGDRATFIRGNADRNVLARDSEQSAWCAERLTKAQLAFVAACPETVTLAVDGLGPVLFCHGSPRSDEEIITAVTPLERLRSIVAGVAERVVVCGHTHAQFDRVVDGVRVLNAGSVGLPYEGQPGAYWLSLGPDVEHRRTDYDLATAVDRMRATGFPRVEEMLGPALLAPVSPEETAAYFEGMAREWRGA